jgi:hypothetical protein
MLTQEVNVEAMYLAQKLLLGEDTTMMIAQLADAIDVAMKRGYDLGRYEAEQNIEDRLDNAFDEGFEQGASYQELVDDEDNEQTAAECFDDGYLEGVDDTLNRTLFAASEVQRIINARAEEFFTALEDTDELVIDEA